MLSSQILSSSYSLSTYHIASTEKPYCLEIEHEINQLKDSQDPEPDPTIKYMIVLSASHSYLHTPDVGSSPDLEDDYNRMELALNTAKKIAALNAHTKIEELNLELLRQHGPLIVYNGSEEQNHDLQSALNRDMVNYPKDKFIILDLPKDNINTKGQFLSIKQHLPLTHVTIALITHAYHFPRIARMLGENAPLYPFGNHVKKYAFLTDRQFLSPGIDDHVKHEIEKIPTYIDKGDLAKEPAHDVIYLLPES